MFSAGVKIGDILVIFPDAESLKHDRSLGYFLTASFGKVTRVGQMDVGVPWLFAETYSSKLRSWKLPNGIVYEGSIWENEIYTGDTQWTVALKAELDKNKKLKEVTKRAIRKVVGVEEFNVHDK